jgi:hypothetical protein
MSTEPAAAASHSVYEVGIDDKLPLDQLIILAFQNIFGMTGMFKCRRSRSPTSTA